MNFKEEIAKLLYEQTKLEVPVEVPPDNIDADYACPCFKLAKVLKQSPQKIAEDIAQKIVKPNFISRVENQGGYVNFHLARENFVRYVISKIAAQKDNSFFKSQIGYEKTIVFDYSSPNIAKPFHVGHLRSTVIGNALYNIYAVLGYNCISVNHLGDWGTQFGKLITAYKLWGNREDVERDGIKELNRLYVMFHQQATDELEDTARNWLIKMQNGDDEALSLWQWFFDISMREFEKIYVRLGIKFDYYTGESFYNDKLTSVADKLFEHNLLVESEGAMIVELENMPPCLILRKDGGSLYPTRDIAAAIYRHETFKFDKCVYVTALDQKLHFEQWFNVIKLMGYEWADDLVHVAFGLVSLDSGKLSTRSGNVVLMEELLDEAAAKTEQIISEKNPTLHNKKEIADAIGISAIVFNDLYNSRIKDITFSWDKILNFDGETGPYVQYTYVRTCSLLNKAGEIRMEIDENAEGDEGFEIAKLIYSMPETIHEAAEKFEPYIISRKLIQISQAFNKFYHDNKVLSEENESKRNMRLALTASVNSTLKFGMQLLGLHITDVM